MIDEQFLVNAGHLILGGVNPNYEDDKSLEGTPERFASAMCEILSGTDVNADTLVKEFDEDDSTAAVIQKGIPFYSMCKHHILPFFGTADVWLLRREGKILGLSKIPRIVKACSRKLQVQERLTYEIADALFVGAENPLFVGVRLRARHMCMEMRGVCVPGIETVTTSALSASSDEDEYEVKEIKSLLKRFRNNAS